MDETKETLEDTIGADFLRSLREQHDLTVYDMAKKFDIPLQTYRQWESGRRNPPDYVVRMMMQVFSYEELHQDRNRDVMRKRMNDDIMMSGCPVLVYDCHANPDVISYVDELGERKYYVVAGSISKEDLALFRYWLNLSYDEKANDELQERLSEYDDEDKRRQVLRDYRRSQKLRIRQEYEEVQKKLQKIREDAAQICEDAAKVHEANAVQSGE